MCVCVCARVCLCVCACVCVCVCGVHNGQPGQVSEGTAAVAAGAREPLSPTPLYTQHAHTHKKQK